MGGLFRSLMRRQAENSGWHPVCDELEVRTINRCNWKKFHKILPPEVELGTNDYYPRLGLGGK
jgi:hypothetical protein